MLTPDIRIATNFHKDFTPHVYINRVGQKKGDHQAYKSADHCYVGDDFFNYVFVWLGEFWSSQDHCLSKNEEGGEENVDDEETNQLHQSLLDDL